MALRVVVCGACIGVASAAVRCSHRLFAERRRDTCGCPSSVWAGSLSGWNSRASYVWWMLQTQAGSASWMGCVQAAGHQGILVGSVDRDCSWIAVSGACAARWGALGVRDWLARCNTKSTAVCQRVAGTISHQEGAVSEMLQDSCWRCRVQFTCGMVEKHDSGPRLTRQSREQRMYAQTGPIAVLMMICQSEGAIGPADSVHGPSQHQQEPRCSVHAVLKRGNSICSRLDCGFCS